MTNSWLILATKIALTLWLFALSVKDHLHRRIPNGLVLPVMFGALAWQVYIAITTKANALGFIALAWVAIFMLWRAHIFGGGDAKFLMALFALFPSVEFLCFFSLVVLLVSLPLLLAQAVKTRESPFRRLAEGLHGLPTADDLRRHGRPYCWTLALPGAIYLWWVL